MLHYTHICVLYVYVIMHPYCNMMPLRSVPTVSLLLRRGGCQGRPSSQAAGIGIGIGIGAGAGAGTGTGTGTGMGIGIGNRYSQ